MREKPSADYRKIITEFQKTDQENLQSAADKRNNSEREKLPSRKFQTRRTSEMLIAGASQDVVTRKNGLVNDQFP